jgi:lipoprotein-anchoring transpeptidase ErfK/SrfK
VRRVGLAATALLVCALAGILAASVLADNGSPTTTTTTTEPPTTTTTAPTTTDTTATATTPTTTTTTPTTTTTRSVPVALPAGVRVGGIAVGGLARADAASAVQAAFQRPLLVRFASSTMEVSMAQLGASAAVQRTVRRAARAAPGSTLPLDVKVVRARVTTLVARLAERFKRDPVDSQLFLRDMKPWISPGKPGRTLDRRDAVIALVTAIQRNDRSPIVLHAKAVKQEVTRGSFGPVIVIRRGSNQLILYHGMRLVQSFAVATGQSVYPTPLGRFQIIVKWRDPWWYPPASPWAKGEKPVPPGPGNPLGTRWMGLSSPGVGIHGTPDDASIGYSASHGCIRMHIPQAEWLFNHVDIGTPVFIVGT